MVTIEIAGLRIGLDTDEEYMPLFCGDFLCGGAPAFTVRATEQQVQEELARTSCRRSSAVGSCLYREIAERLPAWDRFVLHGAAVQVGGRAYIFSAKSGTGKTTHVRLWQQRYGEAVRIVNGDKPVIWKTDGGFLACGTPWCGKEWQTSTDCVPVGGLCFLERAEENTIRRASPSEIAERIFHQVYRPKDAGQMLRFLTLLDEFLNAVPCWRMGCNMEPAAAELSYEAMTEATHGER